MQPLSYFFCLASEIARPSAIALSLSITTALLSINGDGINLGNHSVSASGLSHWVPGGRTAASWLGQ